MRQYLTVFILLFYTLCLPGVSQGQIREELPHLAVLSASSLTNPLTEIVRLYSRKENITVTTSFDATSEQARKIMDGHSADIFISAHPAWMKDLKEKGLIDVYSLKNLVTNRLALVVSEKTRLDEKLDPQASLAQKIDYLDQRTILVMSHPDSNALGRYTKEALQALEEKEKQPVWSKIELKALRSAGAKNTLYQIVHGNTAGIVYYTDAKDNRELRLLEVVDKQLHQPITYQVAVVAGENMSGARHFLAFLKGAEAREIFQKYHFEFPEEASR